MNYSIAIDNIGTGQLDLIEDMRELQQKYLDSVQNLTVRQATQKLPPILVDYCSLMENFVTMIADMDILEKRTDFAKINRAHLSSFQKTNGSFKSHINRQKVMTNFLFISSVSL